MNRPTYVVCHRCNDPEDIVNGLGFGANAIECDVRWGRVTVFGDYHWYVDHDGVYAWSTRLDEWLLAAADAAHDFAGQFALIYVDIKTPEELVRLRDDFRAALPPDLNILYSVPSREDAAKFDVIAGDLRYNEGLSIDSDNYPGLVQSYFVEHLKVFNFWYGDGIFVGGVGPNVRDSLVTARDLRDSEHEIKKTCVWTLAKDSSIEDYIDNVTVDAMLVNTDTVSDAVAIVKNSSKATLASRWCRAFFNAAAGDEGVDQEPRSIVDNWIRWPSDFTPIDAAIFWSNGKGYFFKGEQYLRYKAAPGEGVAPGYPEPIIGLWKKWPRTFLPIDAAVFWPNDIVYIFKGDQFLKYDVIADEVKGEPESIAGHWPGWPSDFHPIDAAIVYPTGKAYFFKGDQYLRYTIGPKEGVDEGFPRPIIGNWPNWPENFLPIDSAVLWPNGYLYFFKGSEYIRYQP